MHSIEVILTEDDLQRSFNSRQFQQHMNYLWIAMPSDLIEKIGSRISDDYGIIEIGYKNDAIMLRNSAYYSVSKNKLDLIQELLINVL